MKRFFDLLLAFVLLLCAIPVAPVSAEVTVPDYDYEDLYVKDGLVALYLAFDDTDLSRDAGSGDLLWENRILADGDHDARLSGAYWKIGKNGGVGFLMTHDEWKQDYAKVKLTLPDEYAALPDCTVEATAAFYGITDAKGTTRYDSSSKAEPFGCYIENLSAFRLDMFMSESFCCPLDDNYNGSDCSLCNRWWVTRTYYQTYQNISDNETIFGSYNDHYLQGTQLHDVNTLILQKLTDKSGNVSFATGWNTSNFSVQTPAFSSAQYAKIRSGVTSGGATRPVDPAGLCSLFNGYPANVYAIRVYNRVLTDAEREHNHAVDMMGVYKLDRALFDEASDTQKESVLAYLGTLVGSEDPDVQGGVRAQYALLLGDEETYLQSILSYRDTTPVLDGLAPGVSVSFRISAALAGQYRTRGYELIAGTVTVPTVVNGARIASPEDVKILLKDGKVVCDAPGAEITVALENPTIKSSINDLSFSTTLSFDKEKDYENDFLIRGFTVLRRGDDEHIICTDVPESAPLSGEFSMADAAEYFVNEYDKDVTLSDKYRTDEGLLAVLEACGIEARKSTFKKVDLYVDPDGDDRGDGSADEPVATVAAVFRLMKRALSANEDVALTVHLSEGVHRLSETQTLSAADIRAPHYSIRFVGEGDGTVVTSTVPIGAAQYDSATDLYKVSLPRGTYFRYLYRDTEDGLVPVEMVHSGTNDDYAVIGQLFPAGANEFKIYLPLSLFPDKTATYAGAELHLTVEWNFDIIHIRRVDFTDRSGDSVAVYVNRTEYDGMTVYGSVQGRECWLENCYDLFAGAEEDCYYYDRDTATLYLFAYETDWEDETLEIPLTDTLFRFEDVSGISISNMVLTGADNTFVTPDRGLSGGQAGSNRALYIDGRSSGSNGFLEIAAITAKNVSDFSVHDTVIRYVGGDGICVFGATKDLHIYSNEIAHVGETAVRVGKANGSWSDTNKNEGLLIEDNYIHHTGELFVQCCGLTVNLAKDSRICGNTITNTTYTAISLGWNWNEITWKYEEVGQGNRCRLYNVEIAYNYITDFMTCMKDGGGIYILGGNAAYTEPELFNYMHDNYMVLSEASGVHHGPRWMMGYYHDGSSSNWFDYNNVIIKEGKTASDNFIPFYIQSIGGQVTHNDTSVSNYGIGCYTTANDYYGGYSRLTDTSNDIEAHRGVDRNIISNNYFYATLADLQAGEMLPDRSPNASRYNVSIPGALAESRVAAIYANAGAQTAPRLSNGGLAVYCAPTGRTYLVGNNTTAADAVIASSLTGTKVTVTFTVDGAVYATRSCALGAKITLPKDPTKAATATERFVFSGWEGYETDAQAVGDVTYTASFRAVPIDEDDPGHDPGHEPGDRPVRGDVDGDGTVEEEDIRAILDAIRDGTQSALPAACDANGDGVVNIYDIAALLPLA